MDFSICQKLLIGNVKILVFLVSKAYMYLGLSKQQKSELLLDDDILGSLLTSQSCCRRKSSEHIAKLKKKATKKYVLE